MEKFTTYSDRGSVLVGTPKVRFCLPDIGGDGSIEVEIYDKVNNQETVPPNYKFVTVIEGEFNVYSYDCSDGSKEDIVATLRGRYGVYRDWFAVALEKWEN